MTGYLIASFLLVAALVSLAPNLIANYQRRRRLTAARRRVDAERQRELDARRYHETLAEVTSWEPPDLDALAEKARKAAAELEHEPQRGTNVIPIPGSLTDRPDLALVFMDEGMWHHGWTEPSHADLDIIERRWR